MVSTSCWVQYPAKVLDPAGWVSWVWEEAKSKLAAAGLVLKYGWNDRHQKPMSNNKDNLVGQLTSIQPILVADKHFCWHCVALLTKQVAHSSQHSFAHVYDVLSFAHVCKNWFFEFTLLPGQVADISAVLQMQCEAVDLICSLSVRFNSESIH